MKKILITGINGYIGSHLKKYFGEIGYKVFGLDLSSGAGNQCFACDIMYPYILAQVIKKVRPDIVIHAAGLSNLTACEKDPKNAFSINAEGTRNIVAALKKYVPNAKLIFMSTDYVFAGDKGSYSESDKLSPVTIYGKSKLLAENIIAKSLRNYAIIRTANVFGDGGNFYNVLTDSLREGKKFKAFRDVYFTPTYIEYFLDSVSRIIERDLRGLFHIAGRDRVSRFQFAKELAVFLGKPKLVSACRQPQGGLLAKDSSLDSTKTAEILKNYSPSLNKSFKFALNVLVYPYSSHVDDRGMLLGIMQKDDTGEINYVETNKGAVRGGHYHKKSTETFFIIDGKIKVTLKDKGRVETFTATKGDIFCVNPGEYHVFEALTRSVWINIYDRPLDRFNPDIHKSKNK